MVAPALYPAASARLSPEAYTQPRITPRAVIVHSQAGMGSLYGWWLNPASNGLECHLWISMTGKVEQYVPTTVRADANGRANAFAISIETESSRHATERWTPAQAAALVRVIDWCCRTHGIPRRVMNTSVDAGLGWHVMFGAPGPWTSVRGKTCPGPARIEQFRHEIVPAVAALGNPAPEPQPPTVEPEEEPDVKPYSVRAKGPAVGRVKDGSVWIIDPMALTAWRPKNAKPEEWRATVDGFQWVGLIENREADRLPAEFIARFRLVG